MRVGETCQEGVAGGPCGDDDDGVDDAGEDADAGVGDSDDEGGGAGAAAAVGQARVVAGADDADGEDGEDVEDDEAVEEAAAGDGEVAAWGLHFSAGDD